MLHVEHVSKTFFPGTINEKKALQDLSLHLEPGDFATVIGGNGAGKSTTLNAIAVFSTATTLTPGRPRRKSVHWLIACSWE